MSNPLLLIPAHAPLKACPFCERAATVSAHRNAPNQPVRDKVGCWQENEPLLRQPYWDDCFGPLSQFLYDRDELVRLWNQRARDCLESA